MSNGELPEGFFSWVLTGVLAVVTTLAGAVAALFKISESKNTKAIEEQQQEILKQKIDYAESKAQMRTEIGLVRDNLKAVEEARLECERDRAALTAKCEIFEKRLARLEDQA
jgi:septal ring factor EnvC (AmiA/AmiB activator)